MMVAPTEDGEAVLTTNDRSTKIKKITSIAKLWGISGKLTLHEIGLQLVEKSSSHPVRKNLITNLLGIPTARKMFNVPKFITYLSSKTDDSELNLRKQLALWLVTLPTQNLVDHLSSQFGSHDQNWSINNENK
ncbi:hypothetical protein KSF78_0006232 [Schistosoma japonicum]|nr:hypothetical protein KSF78_0006232 [Schistosoma japonicum]